MDVPYTNFTSIKEKLVGKSDSKPATTEESHEQVVAAPQTEPTKVEAADVSTTVDERADLGTKSGTTETTTTEPDDRADRGTTGTIETSDEMTTKTEAPVTHEHINRRHEEELTEVIDKERHQDHYHTTIQPLKDREVEATQHGNKDLATREVEINEEDAAKTAEKLEAQKPQVTNTSTEDSAEESKSQKVVEGDETVHHHHHETVQPVIEKEVVKPSITHTTQHVHETHQEASVVHDTNTAEPMSVDEFKKAGNDVKPT